MAVSRKTWVWGGIAAGVVVIAVGAIIAVGLTGGNPIAGPQPSSTFSQPDPTREPIVSPTPLPLPTETPPPVDPTAPPVPAVPETTVNFTSMTWNPDVSGFDAWASLPYVRDSGGVCTLVVTGADGSTYSAQAAAYADATLTYCDLIRVPGDALTGSAWTAVVTYSSPAYQGVSNTLEVTR